MKMNGENLKALIADVTSTIVNDKFKELNKENQQLANTDTREIIKSIIDASTRPNKVVKEESPGINAAKLIRALTAGKGDPERAIKIIESQWLKGKDDKSCDTILKALSAGDAVAGGFTLSEDLSSEIIELLRPKTSVRGAGPIVIPMPTGSFTLPGLASGAQSNYSGENVNAGVSEQTFRQVKLTFKKLITLVPVSNDLLRYSNSNIDVVVRDDLVNSMGEREDLAFLRGDGSEDTPKGFKTLVPASNKLNANGTVNLDNVTTDLSNLILKLEEGNVRMIRPTWFFAPRTKQYLMTVRDGNGNYAFRDEMLRGMLWGWPFRSTTQIPKNLGGGSNESEVYLVDMADAIIGEGLTLTVDASGEAAYYDGANVVATYSKDQTVVRAIAEHDFNIRHLESIGLLEQVKWGV